MAGDKNTTVLEGQPSPSNPGTSKERTTAAYDKLTEKETSDKTEKATKKKRVRDEQPMTTTQQEAKKQEREREVKRGAK